MNITITARHFKAPEPLKDFVRKEVLRLKKYYDGIIEGEVILSWEKLTQIAEINLKVYGQKLTAKEKSEDIRKSITLAVDKLERQVEKYKEKWHKKGNAKRLWLCRRKWRKQFKCVWINFNTPSGRFVLLSFMTHKMGHSGGGLRHF
jgi:ribosomal subunit interface protein